MNDPTLIHSVLKIFKRILFLLALSSWTFCVIHIYGVKLCITHLMPHVSVLAQTAKMAPTIPAKTPGIPWRLCTPHVSWIFRRSDKNGCKWKTTLEKKSLSIVIYRQTYVYLKALSSRAYFDVELNRLSNMENAAYPDPQQFC